MAPFRNPRSARQGPTVLPQRNPSAHSQGLLRQLDAVEAALEDPSPQPRPPEAVGHLITAEVVPGTTFHAEGLSDVRTDTALVAVLEDEALVHVRRDDLSALRRKIEAYGDPGRRTRRGQPRNEQLVAPIQTIRPATLADLSEGAFAPDLIDSGQVYWVELWTRGGRLETEEERRRVAAEVHWLARLYGVEDRRIHTFRATERDIFLLPLPGRALLQLPVSTPDVYRIAPPSPGLRGLVVLGSASDLVIPDRVQPPDPTSSIVVIVDTGVAAEHPLIRPALIDRGVSVVVGEPSPDDTHGHGTEMAGVAAYADLSESLLATGQMTPRNRLQNIRILVRDQTSDDDREFWPERTERAVLEAENTGLGRRVFNFSIGAINPEAGRPTSWSLAMDLLAFNDGLGRLMVTSAGNANVSPFRAEYPHLNLATPLDDPAHAVNVITTGAITERDSLPADAQHGTLQPLAACGQLSPYSACDLGGVRPIKPDVVVEGGNCAPDGTLPNVGIEALSIVTTSRKHVQGRPLDITYATSPAAANTSGLLGGIWRVNQTRRPETVRGLLIHSARWSPALRSQFPNRRDLLRAVGYGVPRQEAAAYSSRTRPTLIVEDVLYPGQRDEEGALIRPVHFYQLPLPSEQLLALGEQEVELAVTLSFFVEPNESSRRSYAGAMLRWDMQGPAEGQEQFRQRINRLERPADYERVTSSYPWEIGIDTRSRGSVQSDRCQITGADLAGHRLVAVYPTLGWWDRRSDRVDRPIRYSLIVSVDAGNADIDLYALVEVEIAVEVPAT